MHFCIFLFHAVVGIVVLIRAVKLCNFGHLVSGQTEVKDIINRLLRARAAKRADADNPHGFEGMTISSDMTDDALFTDKLRDRTYQFAVMHFKPEGDEFFCKKCGHEDLYISLTPGNPLTFYPELHLRDLDGLSILLLSNIGFWANTYREKTPNSKYLLQIEAESFRELAINSNYPVFSSSYYIRRGETVSGRVNISLVDAECHADYYLVCLDSEKSKYKKLFDCVRENTII